MKGLLQQVRRTSGGGWGVDGRWRVGGQWEVGGGLMELLWGVGGGWLMKVE